MQCEVFAGIVLFQFYEKNPAKLHFLYKIVYKTFLKIQ